MLYDLLCYVRADDKSQLCCVKCVLSWEAGCQPSFSFPGRSSMDGRAEGWASQTILEAVCPAATRIPPILRRSLVFQSIESWVVWRREGRGGGGHWLSSSTVYAIFFTRLAFRSQPTPVLILACAESDEGLARGTFRLRRAGGQEKTASSRALRPFRLCLRLMG
jgi:hypothetical protein